MVQLSAGGGGEACPNSETRRLSRLLGYVSASKYTRTRTYKRNEWTVDIDRMGGPGGRPQKGLGSHYSGLCFTVLGPE